MAATSEAAELPLPSNAAALPKIIAAACPTCAAAGYTPCGTQDVRWGRHFASTALLGTPKRGYLVTFAMSGSDFRTLARGTDYEALRTTLRERFARVRLVVLEDDFADARVLPEPITTTVTFPERLHACVHDTDWPWGCCASDCDQECCEKSLGSPAIDVEWRDGDERLHYHYGHTTGTTWLQRTSSSGAVHYFCLNDAKGILSAPR